MANDEYDKVELPALNQLQSLGWSYIEGVKLSPDESNERTSFKDVVLEERLARSIKQINSWINDENLQKIVRDITKKQFPNLIEANQSIWKTLTKYTSIMQDLGKGNRGQTVKIIDFEDIDNNEFLCTNQFRVEGNQNIIPDIVLFVNGLPLAVIECKSPYITDPMESGIDQLRRYANRRRGQNNEGAEKLFYYNQFMVSTHRDKAQVGAINLRVERFQEWKDPYPLKVEEFGDNPQSQDVLIAGIFDRTNFLDIIRNFTVFESVGGRTVKKIAQYQQFRAVHKSIERIKSGTDRKDKGGVIWHTQGSGKSLTMVFLTLKIRRDDALCKYKLVFITDRTQLDHQLKATFQSAQDERVYPAKTGDKLKELLKKDASDIVMTTVQKFKVSKSESELSVLNESEKIIVLIDEAHRTEYGTLGAALNIGLPNAPKIGFTGTPLIKSAKTTNEFGSYIDTYNIEQSIEDGTTVQIIYEGREAQLYVTSDSLDSLFKEYFGDKTEKEQADIKRKYGTKKAVLEAPPRIRRVCIDILKHYREFIQPNGFKAMIVTSSRYAAITYKKIMDELEAPESEVIISKGHNDEERYRKYISSAMQKRKHIENYKKAIGSGEGQSNLSFLIVKGMLLTGFDAPIAQVMYLDCKLTEHTLFQAIARVNRTNENKFRGCIVDYFGLSDYLTTALEMFSSDDIKGALRELKDEIPKLQYAHTRVMQYFKDMDINDTDKCIRSLKDEIKRREFHLNFQKFLRQMYIVLPDSAAGPFIFDLKQMDKILHGAKNLYRDEQFSTAGVGTKIRKLIEDHIVSIGVNLKIPPVDILAKDFKEKLNARESPRVKASEIESAIKRHIEISFEEDPVYYELLSKKLEKIIQQCGENWDETVQLLMPFCGTIEEERKKLADNLGLTETEAAFYRILEAEMIKNEGVIDKEMNIKMKRVTQELVTMMEEATKIVDFFQKPDKIKLAKRGIKRAILDKFNDDNDNMVKCITKRFMELAEVKFKSR